MTPSQRAALNAVMDKIGHHNAYLEEVFLAGIATAESALAEVRERIAVLQRALRHLRNNCAAPWYAADFIDARHEADQLLAGTPSAEGERPDI